MRRLPTALALCSWLSFLVVSAVERGIAVYAALGQDTGTVDPSSLLARVDLAGFALSAAVVSMVAALAFLNEERTDRRWVGEWLGYAGLAVVAIVAASPGKHSVPDVASLLGFWASLAGAGAAMTFDHVITDESVDDEAEFRAGIAVIASAMARQTHLYAKPDPDDGVRPRG